MPTPSVSQCLDDLARHEGWIRSIARARLRCLDAVDDVLGEVTHDALSKKDCWHEIRDPGPWLYRLTIRKVLLYRRSAGRRRKLENAVAENVESNERGQTPIDKLVKEEDSIEIRRAMEKLTGRDAEILILKYVHRWNYEQISQNLGIEKNKIANRLRNARARLKSQLEKLGIENI